MEWYTEQNSKDLSEQRLKGTLRTYLAHHELESNFIIIILIKESRAHLSQWRCWQNGHWRQLGAFRASQSHGFPPQPWWELGGKWSHIDQSPRPIESQSLCTQYRVNVLYIHT